MQLVKTIPFVHAHIGPKQRIQPYHFRSDGDTKGPVLPTVRDTPTIAKIAKGWAAVSTVHPGDCTDGGASLGW